MNDAKLAELVEKAIEAIELIDSLPISEETKAKAREDTFGGLPVIALSLLTIQELGEGQRDRKKFLITMIEALYVALGIDILMPSKDVSEADQQKIRSIEPYMRELGGACHRIFDASMGLEVKPKIDGKALVQEIKGLLDLDSQGVVEDITVSLEQIVSKYDEQ